jgi:mevalonate kinase
VEKDTKVQLQKVKDRLQDLGLAGDHVLSAIQEISALAQLQLCSPNSTVSSHLPSLIDTNQALLVALNSSHSSIDTVVQACQRHGFAAKLTGAGGGGCVLTYIAQPDRLEALQKDITQLGMTAINTQVGAPGIKVHSLQLKNETGQELLSFQSTFIGQIASEMHQLVSL